MKFVLVKVLLAGISLLVALTGILVYVKVAPTPIKQQKVVLEDTKQKTATCDMSDFKNFPKEITGPVTLELKSLMTVMVRNKKKTGEVEITLPKTRCEVE